MADEIFQRAAGVAMDALCSRVGDLVTSLWDRSFGLVVNLILLSKNADGLTQEMQKLDALRKDLSDRAELEACQPRSEVTNQLSGWMERVESLRSEVTKFEDAYDSQSICITGLCLGYKAADLLRQVKQQIEEGNSLSPTNELVCRRVPDSVQRIPFGTSGSSVVGALNTLQQIQGHIMDDGVGVIGIYGMGGVGKTTLLKIINNEFLLGEAKGKFEVAIWVTVSKDINILGIQKDIGDRLGFSLSSDSQGEPSASLIDRQAVILFERLAEKRFILLLDDMWEKIDLVNIGIPRPDESNNHKLLFTTRNEEVCHGMGADEIVNVSLLDDKDSWKLFQSKLGRKAALDNEDIQKLAKQVVAKCGGLPISLITVGGAMANATTLHDWRNAIDALDHNAVEVSGMAQVLVSLKFSFDMLNNGNSFNNEGLQLQSCLLYCALFPEDYSIPKGEIIDYWISEGFLDPVGYRDIHIDQTRDRGHDRIRRLQNACLLEHGMPDDGRTVKLHDSVRDMALWITRQEFVVLAGRSSARVPQIETWESATRISLMSNFGVKEPPSWQLRCPALTTLVLCDSTLGGLVSQGFLRHMPALRVLDLSNTRLKEFPLDITALVELRYLNLTGAQFNTLPAELGNLTNLRQLILKWTTCLEKIPKAAISRLSRLQVLDMKLSTYVFGRGDSDFLELSDLERLSSLCDLCLEIESYRSQLKILSSNMLSRCVRYLRVRLLEELCTVGALPFDKMTELRCLFLVDNFTNPLEGELTFCQLPYLEVVKLYRFLGAEIVFRPVSEQGTSLGQPLFPRLRELNIDGCDRFTDLTWVGRLPCLEQIYVENCDGMTELLLDGGGVPDGVRTTFPRLKGLHLHFLPSLRSISSHVLPFPCLKLVSVRSCPNLKRLPLGPQSANKIRMICGEQEWWDGLEWDTHAEQSSVRSHFLACFEASEAYRMHLYWRLHRELL